MSTEHRILGVLDYGRNDGFPFASLFDGIRNINTVAEFDNAKNISAVVFWGGTDISPSLYGQKANEFCQSGNMPSARDLREISIARKCVEAGVPMIGVCRGAQLMCVVAGGKLAQHVDSHSCSHWVADLATGESYMAPAEHHQMMLVEGTEHKLIAVAAPNRTNMYIGENDAINMYPHGFKEPEIVWFPKIKALAIQPHPEWCELKAQQGRFIRYCNNLVKEFILNASVCHN